MGIVFAGEAGAGTVKIPRFSFRWSHRLFATVFYEIYARYIGVMAVKTAIIIRLLS